LRTQAALALSPRAARVVALSGTPLWNKPIGLWPILACLNPGAWGTYYSFGERYSDGKKGAWGFRATGVSHVDEFRARMSEVALRRTWEDVAADLPPVTRSVEVADLSSDQAREVDFAAEAVRVAGATRTPVGELARYRQLVGHLKIPATVEAVKALVQEGETALVVWCWHRAVAGALVTAFSREFQGQLVSLAVTGDDPIEIRDTKLAFWRGEAGGILVITMAVGQTGIDLSRARHAVFAELDFTPSVVAQAEARTYAPSRPSAATYLVVDHRVERALADALVKKCDLGAVLGTPAAEAAVDILRQAFDVAEVGDLERLRAAVLEDLP
jgi:SWI/SNF-related matrix-associated actin-dependent regulator 1 of chromatin subfamily A